MKMTKKEIAVLRKMCLEARNCFDDYADDDKIVPIDVVERVCTINDVLVALGVDIYND